VVPAPELGERHGVRLQQIQARLMSDSIAASRSRDVIARSRRR